MRKNWETEEFNPNSFFLKKCEDIDLGNALKVMYLCGEAGELAHIIFSNKVIVITYYGGSGQGRVDICDISDELGYMVTERILITAENLKEVLQKAIRDINKNDLFD